MQIQIFLIYSFAFISLLFCHSSSTPNHSLPVSTLLAGMSIKQEHENHQLKSQTLDNTAFNRTQVGNSNITFNNTNNNKNSEDRDKAMKDLENPFLTNENTKESSESKDPKTPSFAKPATFASPAHISIVPETPERVPRHIQNFENTPLLSPPQTSSGNLLQTPQRRNGNDFYSLLKSPDVRIDDKNLKRRSVELFNVTSVKSPEQLHKEYDGDHLLKSPRRDYKEIRKISENLRTRLNYANVKIQHGWSNKSIGELEHSLEEIASNPRREKNLNINNSNNDTNKELEDFWNLKTDNLPSKHDNQNLSSLKQKNLLESPSKFTNTRHRRRSSLAAAVSLDEIAKRGIRASPEQKHSSEFSNSSSISMQHNSSSKSSSLGLQASPSKQKEKMKLTISTKNKNNGSKSLEQDAIISLISLSSPKKYHSSSFSPSPPKQFVSPVKGISGGLPSLDGVSNKMLPPLPNSLNMPLSAPGVMSGDSNGRRYSNSSDINPQSQYTFPPQTKFGLGMGISMSNSSNNSVQRISNDETEDETTEEEIIDDD